MILAGFALIWLVLGGFALIWLVLAGFGWFWLVLACFGWFWVVLARFGWFWVVSYFSIDRFIVFYCYCGSYNCFYAFMLVLMSCVPLLTSFSIT